MIIPSGTTAPAPISDPRPITARLSTIAPSSNEHSLMLKTQGSSWSSGHIEVNYRPAIHLVSVLTLNPPGSWVTHGTIPGVTLAPGDQFGARALADGTVQVYRNGTLLGAVSVAGWPFAAMGGRIGVSVYNSPGSRFDDFGGGSLPTTLGVSQSARISLSAGFPNPTVGGVAMSLELARDEDVGLSVSDVQGREVWGSPARRYGMGRSTLVWDGRSTNGTVPDGTYFVRVRVGSQQFVRRVAKLR